MVADLSNLVLVDTDNLPIRHEGKIHSGKVRSVYWLTQGDSSALIEGSGYAAHPDTQLGVMVTSDRISAFDCNWKGEDGLHGVPGKGASLNADSLHWFDRFTDERFIGNHVLDAPHPLVWIVQRAQPIMVEAIARSYITGSMWRDYNDGQRVFGGVTLPNGLTKNQKLDKLLITPSTKGIMRGIPGVPEKDDVNITRVQIKENFERFGFRVADHIMAYEYWLGEGVRIAEDDLADIGQILVDTKFEFGYVKDPDGVEQMIYIDEVVTPDSSRFWPVAEYDENPLTVTEESKEGFRRFLMSMHGREIFTDKSRMAERVALAEGYRVPVDQMMEVAKTYASMAKRITGKPVPNIENAREEIMEVMSSYGLAV